MKKRTLIIFCFLLTHNFSCKKTNNTTDDYSCVIEMNKHQFSQNEILEKFNLNNLRDLAGANSADATGAISENKTNYLHVRFQMGLLHLSDYAIVSKDLEALEMTVKAIEYSFEHQETNGDFLLQLPPDLIDVEISEGDRISGNSFFLSALGLSLLSMEESQWFNNQTDYKQRIDILKPQFQSALEYLKSQTNLLKNYDSNAPNRLFFDAIAFYCLGQFLDDTNSTNLGLEFLELALSKQHEKGYFLELNGWDSSYQGVGLINGFRLLAILNPNSEHWQNLYNSISCGTNWELSRISESGEISTDGNTRVFEGGETFMGREKQVAYASVALAFFNMYFYTEIEKYNDYAYKIIEFYN